MTYFAVTAQYPVFSGLDGLPLENGYIYIGEPNKNPITNPVTIYSESNNLYPLAQPVRTIGGYADNNGTPINIYLNDNVNRYYSILVQDKQQRTIYYNKNTTADWNQIGNDALVKNETELLAADASANLIRLGADITLTASYTPSIPIETNGYQFSGSYTIDFSNAQPSLLTKDCFDTTITVTGLKVADPEYFGMDIANTGAVNAAAFMKAVRGAEKIVLGVGDYAMDTDTIIFDSDAENVAHTVIGAGYQTNLDFSASTTGTCIQVGPLVVSDYTINHGTFYIFDNFRIQCGAVDYDDDQIGINFNGVSRSRLDNILIYNSGDGVICRGFGNVFNHLYVTSTRACFWFPAFAFNNTINNRTEANVGLYGVLIGPIISSPYSADATSEGNYATDISIDNCIIEGQASQDTGGGHVGGVGVWAANGVERLTITNTWFEAITSTAAGTSRCIQLGNNAAGTDFIYAPDIRNNSFTGAFTNMSGAIKIVRVIGGSIKNNYAGASSAYLFDTGTAAYWQGTDVSSNFWAGGVSFDSASFASVVGGVTVPTGGVHNITGNAQITGDITSTTGDIYSTAGDIQATAGNVIAQAGAAKFGNDIVTPRHQAYGHYTGNFTSYTDVNIPTACGGIIMVVLTGTEHSIAIFNNPAGTLTLTVISDTGGILSAVGNAIRVTKAGGNAFISLFGREVDGTTITVVNPV